MEYLLQALGHLKLGPPMIFTWKFRRIWRICWKAELNIPPSLRESHSKRPPHKWRRSTGVTAGQVAGFFLVNDLQTPPPPLKKRADGKNFLAYISDDFKTEAFSQLRICRPPGTSFQILLGGGKCPPQAKSKFLNVFFIEISNVWKRVDKCQKYRKYRKYHQKLVFYNNFGHFQ